MNLHYQFVKNFKKSQLICKFSNFQNLNNGVLISHLKNTQQCLNPWRSMFKSVKVNTNITTTQFLSMNNHIFKPQFQPSILNLSIPNRYSCFLNLCSIHSSKINNGNGVLRHKYHIRVGGGLEIILKNKENDTGGCVTRSPESHRHCKFK